MRLIILLTKAATFGGFVDELQRNHLTHNAEVWHREDWGPRFCTIFFKEGDGAELERRVLALEAVESVVAEWKHFEQ